MNKLMLHVALVALVCSAAPVLATKKGAPTAHKCTKPSCGKPGSSCCGR